MHHVLSRVRSRRLALPRLAALAAALALMAAACGDDDNPVAQSGGTQTTRAETTSTTEGNGGGAPAGATDLTLVGKDIKFDKTELSLPAGADGTITFENQDDGIPHNLRVDGPEKFATEIENGPVTQELELRIDEAGSYKYLCEVHPEEMKGTLTVE